MANAHGLLVMDKPAGITSRDAVNRAQRWFPRGTRIGHTGTLDPLATGVLVLCVGSATRLAEYVQAMPKVYRAVIVLGASSDTDDADGTIIPTLDAQAPTREVVAQALTSFIGTIEQIPPEYSAAKVTGRRAYDLARKGKPVDLAPRPVAIHRIDVARYAYPHFEVVVECGKGTYIRSLARDLGRRFGCGGYIAALRRLRIGGFAEADAIALDADASVAQACLLPTWRAIQDRPPAVISDVDAAKLRQGQSIAHLPEWSDRGPLIAVADSAGSMLAVVESANGQLRPIKVLAESA